MKKSKYIFFEEVTLKINPKDILDECVDKKHFVLKNKKNQSMLGWINYYPKWKKYVYTSYNDQIIFDDQCLYDIANFVLDLNQGITKNS